MSEEKTEKANSTQEDKRVAVRKVNKRVPSSYANVFQTRTIDNMICVSYGVSYPENIASETCVTVDLERRIIMSPEAARRLAQALNRLLAVKKEGGEAH
ncbi:MAG: hypothetical protein IJU79_03275 [Desulfovibrionaceae bacterium]|nr:hypothetical protein [Desulfovibrionaceae bacterium]